MITFGWIFFFHQGFCRFAGRVSGDEFAKEGANAEVLQWQFGCVMQVRQFVERIELPQMPASIC